MTSATAFATTMLVPNTANAPARAMGRPGGYAAGANPHLTLVNRYPVSV